MTSKTKARPSPSKSDGPASMTCQASDPRRRSRSSGFPRLPALLAALLATAAWAQQPGAVPAPAEPASSPEPMTAASAAAPAVALPSSAPAVALPSPAPKPQPLPVTSGSAEWQALSPAQRQVLAPLEQEWNGLDGSRKGKWLELANRYPQLPADEQLRVQERMNAWVKLSPAERQQARVGFQVAQQLKADERQAKWEAYQALPVERRQELADKAAHKLAQGQPGIAGRTAETKAATGQGAKPNLVLLLPRPQADQPGQPLGPTVAQAKPGATTVLIGAGKTPWQRPGGRARLTLDTSRIDSKTLLPKPAASAPEAAPKTP